MNNIIKSRIAIFLTSLIVSYFISDVYENILGFLLILSIGVIHGANDLLIINRYSAKESNKNQILFFFFYLMIVFIGFALFYFIPSLALLAFIAVSVYHFGEQHWEVNLSNTNLSSKIKLSLIISHGLAFFIIIFMNNLLAVNEVLASFYISSLNYSYLALSLFSVSILYLFLLVYNKVLRNHFINEIIFFVLLYILTLSSTLIYGFAIYFIFFHSLLSIKDQVKFIYNDDKTSSIKKYIRNSMPYFILALTFLLIFYFYVDLQKVNLLQIIFTFLAAITFPHVIVIEKMYSHKK
jgi:Brp/Blh family beta-carotene 15,15'-monooxygenase